MVGKGEVGEPGDSPADPTSQVLIRVKDPASSEEGYFERSLLRVSDYFKDGLKRWKSGTETPSFELVLPEGSSASKGLQLLKQRLSSAVDEENEAWNIPKWWRATDGDNTSLMTALYIFDHIVAKQYRDEVAETIDAFRIPCAEPYLSIMRQSLPHGELSHQESRLPKIKVDRDTLRSLIETAMMGTDESRILADRAMASSSVDDLVPLLWPAFLRVDWDSDERIDAQNWIFFHVELVGARSRKGALKLLRTIVHDVQGCYQTSSWRLRSLQSPAFHAGDALLHGILLNACRRREVPKEEEEALQDFFLNVTDQIEKLRSSFPPAYAHNAHFGWNMFLFEVAPVFVQRAILEALQTCYIENSERSAPALLEEFLGNVSVVAPEARHVFLRMTKFLEEEDIEFLHAASFPGLDA
mmetsp:Transcript_97856/g.204032  ORF Transcript_97856/g.204032 Transcript_97856/m.204032 type:complete len:413 (+) Transcript_97856:228-1466(+)|eukprot:CAMPEP_0206431988 /NCGR_PEP_ID=MMETSP0324_2-20121206/7666_1 /ASSEMBLY_ACC=CAM_ASM_000836 /TAXON_ID=2866 /ORGANISM="Crypthecodinium cohnii, Strain Seligo" /LENGTH=412 /DNA_ID=CAMNT_0053897969 /DNA_START=151 /DNA_END=1389 /DNA_ORIENTATION=+